MQFAFPSDDIDNKMEPMELILIINLFSAIYREYYDFNTCDQDSLCSYIYYMQSIKS